MASTGNEKVQINKLLGIGLKKLRGRMGLGQSEWGASASASQKTISNWEGEGTSTLKSKPSLEQMLSILSANNFSFDDLVEATVLQLEDLGSIDISSPQYKKGVDILKKYIDSRHIIPDVQLDESYDSREDHLQMLQSFANMEYRCYYMHTYDKNKLTWLTIKTLEVDRKGFLPFEMNIEDYSQYVGKIIAPINTGYVYFYFNRKVKDNFKERGLITAFFPVSISGPYMGGVGYMQSLSRVSHINTLQKVAILPADMKVNNKGEKKSKLIELLKLHGLSTEHHFMMSDPSEEHEMYYNLFIKNYKSPERR